MTQRRAWWAVFVFTIALTLNFLDRQLLSLLATPIKRDLGLSDTEIDELRATEIIGDTAVSAKSKATAK